ncbi:MAG: T9SS type A sorting domain-containing protein [Bacteroidota bacterium]
MKKTLLILAFIAISMSNFAQDTIIGFSFPLNDTVSKYPNKGLISNLGNVLRFENAATSTNDSITFTNGVTTGDYAATTTKWDNGDTIKSWTIKFKASNYTNFKISSKQRGGGTTPGPKNFQIQWRLNAGTYADVPNGAIICANDWTTGVVNQLPLPITGQGTAYIYVRWLMKGNLDVNGGTVAATGVSKIDDILITATNTVGIEETVYKNETNIYPNPSTGIFTINTSKTINEVKIYTILGKLVSTIKSVPTNNSIDLSAFGNGIYFVNIKYDDKTNYTTKLIVR